MKTSHAEQHADRQTVYYHNLQDAIDWLGENFGLDDVPSGHSIADGDVITLQLGATAVDVRRMPSKENDRSPSSSDSKFDNQSCYVLVADIEKAWAFLSSTDAPLVFDNPPDDKHERSFGVRDPEGVIWFFGSSANLPPQSLPSKPSQPKRSGAFLATLVLLAVGLGATGLYVGYTRISEQRQEAARQAKLDQERLQRVERQLRAAQAMVAESKAAADRARQELVRQREIQQSSQKAITAARRQIDREKVERQRAERRIKAMVKELQQRQTTESVTSLANQETEIQLGRNKTLRMAAEHKAARAKSRAIQARAQREASEAKVQSLREDLLRHQKLQSLAAAKISVLVRDLAREKENRWKAERALDEVRISLARERDLQSEPIEDKHERAPTTKMTSTSAGDEATETWPISRPIIAPKKRLPIPPAPVRSPAVKTNLNTGSRNQSRPRSSSVRRTTRPNRNRTNSTTARFRTRPRL